MNKKATLFTAAFAALCLLSGPAAAEEMQSPHHSPMHGGWHDMGGQPGMEPKRCEEHDKPGHHAHGYDNTKDRHHAMRGMHHGKGDLLQHREALELTDDQVEKIKTLKRATQKKTIGLNADIDIAEIDLKALIHTDKTDMKAIAKTIKEISDKEADIKIAWIQFKVDSKAVLNEKQLAQLKEIYMQRHPHKDSWH